jgi:2-(3-amino-3-carboxypropyl)histidine synthase
VQHKDDIPGIIKFYEENGKKVILSKKKGRVAYEGHIVGCQYSGLKEIQSEVDAFVILGNQFHSMGAVLAVKKPVILIDVYNDKIREMKGIREKILKQRAISIEKLREARKVGIIIEIKPGQRFGSPKLLLEKLKEAGKTAIVITMNEITPDKIMNFYDIDCFVELACPRIAIDDFAKYPRPIVTYREALVALGEKSWKELLENGFI